MVAMRICQESTPLANVHPQNGGLRPRRARRRGSRALGWLATGALLIAEALAAVVLVIVGLGLFARVHVASQASVESLVAAPLMEPRLSDRQTMRPIPAPSDQRIERPAPFAGNRPAPADALPATDPTRIDLPTVAIYPAPIDLAETASATVLAPPRVEPVLPPAAVPDVTATAPGSPPRADDPPPTVHTTAAGGPAAMRHRRGTSIRQEPKEDAPVAVSGMAVETPRPDAKAESDPPRNAEIPSPRAVTAAGPPSIEVAAPPIEAPAPPRSEPEPEPKSDAAIPTAPAVAVEASGSEPPATASVTAAAPKPPDSPPPAAIPEAQAPLTAVPPAPAQTGSIATAPPANAEPSRPAATGPAAKSTKAATKPTKPTKPRHVAKPKPKPKPRVAAKRPRVRQARSPAAAPQPNQTTFQNNSSFSSPYSQPRGTPQIMNR